jgi:phosphoserine/homoserine phosphotransferase
MDIEGCLLPEFWIAVARDTGIKDLELTTRDVESYDELMRFRIETLRKHGIRMPDIQRILGGVEPLAGAVEFLRWLRERHPVILLSDSYYELLQPFLSALEHPTIFCHHLEVDGDGYVSDYLLRQTDAKRKSIRAMGDLQFGTIAIGDAFNDVPMLQEADHGILYRPSNKVLDAVTEFPVAWDYEQLQSHVTAAAEA